MEKTVSTRTSSTAAKVAAIVLNWENFEATMQCVDSLLSQGYPCLRILIVDNGSKDDSVKQLRDGFPQLTIIENHANLGFAKGCNAGVRVALQDAGCNYVLLLNNDATLSPGTLENGTRFAQADACIGAISGKVLFSSARKTLWYAGASFDRWRGRAVIRAFGETDHGQFDFPCETDLLTGAMMLVKREVFDRVGFLAEEYFFGYEEWDFSFRAKSAGYKLYYVPDFVAYHTVDGSHRGAEPKFIYNAYRNKLILQENYLPRPIFPLWKAAFAVYGKYLARRARERLMRNHPVDVPPQGPLDEFEFALARAIKDHRKNALSERALLEFENDLIALRSNSSKSVLSGTDLISD
ncbi:MAG TPA: glycosyltransferase family 2 protein [Pyrinomonadaceae bacterium]|nr:glycosyltransferase family 2 protein [Pyrinomonadaceae bacterium]